ncbi:MAG: LysR substrate-binding domain-containing protein [Deltaproteobacteria bacterium]|nr:LysR substrate-binding domain-containing protein [Deltaproteobacteria bacterium]
MDAISGMELFVKVVEAKGFRAAAHLSGMSPSAVSKQISKLEDRLGARLLNRTTRRLGLTEVGEKYFTQAQRILGEIEEAERAVSEAQSMPRGLLRISVPLAFGRLGIAPLLPDYLRRYPDVRICVFGHDREVDLIEEGYDLAIRSTYLQDNSTMIARRLLHNRRMVCATPEYWATRGIPKTPDELRLHNCLINPAYSTQRAWHFTFKNKTWVVPVTGNLEFDNPLGLRDVARKGLGVVLLPQYVVQDDVKRGVLVPVLTDYVLEDPDLYILYPSSRNLTPKVRSFVDYLLEHFPDRG